MTNRFQDLMDNPHLLVFYAKGNCNHCRGKGVVKIQLPLAHGGFGEKQRTICQCVKNAVKREDKALARELKEAKVAAGAS